MQINLDHALRKVFSIKINDQAFLQSLSLNPTIRPYLLSYLCDTDFADILKDVLKIKYPNLNENNNIENESEDGSFNLERKYNMDSYTNRAKIGVLSQKMKNFDDLEIEFEKRYS